MDTTASGFTWKFHRLGGLDQVTLRTAEELTHLRDLNPKLWAALSCPASGLEFDRRALALIDTDKDGRIRVPEVLEAVSWLTARLANPADMAGAPEELPLERIAADTPEGRRLLETAKSVLESLGKPDAGTISHADVAEALAHAAQKAFNGDGVIPPLAEFGPGEAAFIADALAVVGGVPDASGAPGINKEIAAAFTKTLCALQAWRETVRRTEARLGPGTAEAWDLLQEIGPRVEDYFLRCEMAAFAPLTRAESAEEARFSVLPENGLMQAAALENLPLARIEPDRPLSMTRGVNPAWRARMARFAALAGPLLPDPDAVTRQDWGALHAAMAPFAEALAQKPVPDPAGASIAPTGSLDGISEERAAAHLSGGVLDAVLGLAARDAAAPAAATDIADLERLVLYHAHLHRLLMNFVSFYDFYSLRHKAMFQSGTLYIAGRSCRLCLPVEDVAKHANLAALSHLCLVYCQCRRAANGPDSGEEMTIVAAVTAGAAEMLVEGRNAVFVDSAGNDWDATVAKVVANPISIRQAMWDPYRRASRMIGEQIGKFAAARQAAVTKSMVPPAAAPAAAPPAAVPAAAAPPQTFDIGKSMGIFAAIGLALGALGTAVASILRGLFSLAWWQFPLVFLGLFLLISGPSMLLAWLKLRKRTLGPLLDASGWAVNSLAPINLKLGGQLTDTAALPCNATRSFNDPLGQPRRWPAVLAPVIGLALAAIAAAAYAWYRWPEIMAWGREFFGAN